MGKLKVLSLFSGIGAFEKALSNIGVNYELVNYCEIDKYASKSYSIIHNVSEKLNLGDITKIDIDKLPCVDLITHGSPCQSWSVAGKQEGGDKGSGTRSSLMWNAVEIVKHKTPKYVIWENVKNVLSKKHIHNFEQYLNELNSIGYTNYYKVLNAKDYGVPQNRERIYVISIFREHEPYEFPKSIKLNKAIKDILENKIEEKYYLSEDVVEKFIPNNNFKSLNEINLPCIGASRGRNVKNEISNKATEQQLEINSKDVSNTLTTVQKDNYVIEPKINQVGSLDIKGNDQIKRVYGDNPLSPTLDTMQGGNRQPKILDFGYIQKGENGTKHQSNTVLDEEGIMRTLTACDYKSPQIVIVDKNIKPSVRTNFEREKYDISQSDKEIYQCECISGWQDNKVGIKVSPTLRAGNPHTCVYCDFRIRKLTPKECWRLMGFEDSDIDKCIAAKISNTQLYKQAGNSIVVNVLEEIFKILLKDYITK